MNWIDKTVAYFNPAKALKRERDRQLLTVMNRGYGNHGASSRKSSMAGWVTQNGSVIDDIEKNIPKLRERSRDLFMGAPLATGALKTMRTNVIGSGLRLNAQVDADYLGMTSEEADIWETKVEREFNLWAESIHCDMQRMNNFYQLQGLAFLSWLMSGDVFCLLPIKPRAGMPYDLRIQLIESDRVNSPDNLDLSSGNPKVLNGVEIDGDGEVIAYHISERHPGAYALEQNKRVRIEKFGRSTGRPNILHLIEMERPEQRRGVPLLAPVIETMKQLARYSDAELMAAVVNALYSVFITSEADSGDGSDPFSSIPEEEEVDSDNDTTIELGPGTVHFLGENEKIQEATPGRPNANFDSFVTSMCRQIGAALEIPYEVLLKNFTSSYSASRGALLEAWKMFKMRRQWMAEGFCQPIYEEFLSEAIAKGRIDAPGYFIDPMIRKAYSGAEWNGPSQGQLDPLKEVNAAEKRVENGFTTRSAETVALGGGDWFRNHNLRVREEQARREAGMASGVPDETNLLDGTDEEEDA
ncbi:phage portal protein [Exiguobacterium sp. MMG028]|uniref:phage portal protein n=1 Tax=Exiguobacterium sp. MMG028 TaxID=3021979 RepID=UPI0022FE8162|nr:phage portal protein [Exiguobacterium sp. MMG028]MDA5559183.1 phage portal protein [Exiguobacterium sp. MMG028]